MRQNNTSEILVLKKLKQNDSGFNAELGFLSIPWFKIKQKKMYQWRKKYSKHEEKWVRSEQAFSERFCFFWTTKFETSFLYLVEIYNELHPQSQNHFFCHWYMYK